MQVLLHLLEELLFTLVSTPLEAEAVAGALVLELLEQPLHWGLALEVAEWEVLELPRLGALLLFLHIDTVVLVVQP